MRSSYYRHKARMCGRNIPTRQLHVSAATMFTTLAQTLGRSFCWLLGQWSGITSRVWPSKLVRCYTVLEIQSTTPTSLAPGRPGACGPQASLLEPLSTDLAFSDASIVNGPLHSSHKCKGGDYHGWQAETLQACQQAQLVQLT